MADESVGGIHSGIFIVTCDMFESLIPPSINSMQPIFILVIFIIIFYVDVCTSAIAMESYRYNIIAIFIIKLYLLNLT